MARRWKLIITIPVILLLVTYVGLKAVPSVYQASAQLLIFDPQQAAAVGGGNLAPSARDFDAVAINTEVAILQSESLALRVARKLNLGENPEFQNQSKVDQLVKLIGASPDGWLARSVRSLMAALRGQDAEPSGGAAAMPGDPAEQRLAVAASMLRDRIKVDHVSLTYVLVISVRSRDPHMAQRLVTTTVDTYFAGRRDAWQQALNQQASTLTAKLAELASRVVEADTAIDEIKARTGLGDGGKDGTSDQQITQLNSQLMQARSVVDEKRVRLEQARRLAGTEGGVLDIPEASASPVLSQLRLQQTQLTQQLAQLRAKLGDRHAQVSALAAQLADVNRTISDQQNHILADMQNAYDIAVRQAQAIEANLQRVTTSLATSGDYAKLQELQRTAAADSKLYNSYLPQLDAVKARQSLGDIAERIITPAGLPTAPVFPPRTLILGGAGFLGFGAGIGLAFIATILQIRQQMGSDAEQIFGYQVLGNIPLVRARKLGRWRPGEGNSDTDRCRRAAVAVQRGGPRRPHRHASVEPEWQPQGGRRHVRATGRRQVDNRHAARCLERQRRPTDGVGRY